jgi:hypothetical protein
MRPNIRRFVRLVHIMIAVGWLGSVASFLVLAITGLTSSNTQIVRSVYLAMDLITLYVIVPLSIAPVLVTGPMLSLGTPWGLFRHYWIVVKLVLNILSTGILLVHLQPIHYLAQIAAERALSTAERGMQVQLVVAAAAGFLALVVLTGLAVFKPRGLTPYGWRKQNEELRVSTNANSPG